MQKDFNERQPVRLTGDNLPYLYDLDYKGNVKYPRFSFYASEAFFHLFRNRYLDEKQSSEQISFGYGGDEWDPFSIIFVPGIPGMDHKISEDDFDPDMHEALTSFFDDLENISDDREIAIFEDENHFFILQAKNPLALYKLLDNYLSEFDVPSKIHSSLSYQGPLKEGFTESEIPARLRTQYEMASKAGMELYNDENTSDTSMGNFALRLCENRAYPSLKAVGVSIAISNEMPLQITMNELKAILQEEIGGKIKNLSGYDLTN